MDSANEERDAQIVAAYEGGLSAPQVARKFRLSVSYTRAILAKCNAAKGPAMPRPQSEKIIDPAHQRLGARLYGFRFRKTNDTQQAADFLGWSVKKLRGVEKGHSVLTLQELQDVASYMEISLSELMKDL